MTTPLCSRGDDGAALVGGRSQTPNTESTKLASTYTPFAGLQANADALVDGLRNGTAITLETTTTVKNTGGTTSTVVAPTTFQPATGKLGYGNVNIGSPLPGTILSALASPTQPAPRSRSP